MIEDILARVSLLRDELDGLVPPPRVADVDLASVQPASPALQNVPAAAHAQARGPEAGQAAGRLAGPEQGGSRGLELLACGVGPAEAEPGRGTGRPAARQPDQARGADDALRGLATGARSSSVPAASGGAVGPRDSGDQGPGSAHVSSGMRCAHGAAARTGPDQYLDVGFRAGNAHLLPAPSTCSDPGRGFAGGHALQGTPAPQQAPAPQAGPQGMSNAGTAANSGGSGGGGGSSTSALLHGAPAGGMAGSACDASSGPGASTAPGHADRQPSSSAEQSRESIRRGADAGADPARRGATAAAAALEAFAEKLARHADELRPRSRQARAQSSGYLLLLLFTSFQSRAV